MKITKSTNPTIYKIAKHVFPEYKGRKVNLSYKESVDTGYNANCSGGSKIEYRFVRLDNGKVLTLPDIAPWKRPESEEVQIPNGAACVTHESFCGQDMGLTVIFPEQNQLILKQYNESENHQTI